MPLTFKYKFGTVRCKIRSHAWERRIEKIFRTIDLQVTFMDCWLHTCNEVQIWSNTKQWKSSFYTFPLPIGIIEFAGMNLVAEIYNPMFT